MSRLTHSLSVLALALAPTAHAAGHVLDNGRVHVSFADPSSGFSAANNNRVDNIAWVGSNGTSTGNLVSAGGPLHCNDPQEFFGQAYGDGGDARPFLVVPGETASWKSPAGNTLTGTTKVNVGKFCDYQPDGETNSVYTLSKTASQTNQMTVQRSFVFKTVSNAGDLRVFVPRLPIDTYAAVLWPNAAGVIQSSNATSCDDTCQVTDWNGTWLAEENSAGQGLMIIRNPKGAPALVVLDNDTASMSNNSSVALSKPADGWLGTYHETQNICFFDAGTWPASRQQAGKLPVGCTMPK